MTSFVQESAITGSTAQALFDWHARPGAFHRLIPPWERVQLVHRGDGLDVGTRTEMRVKLGPLWRPWTALHTACSEPDGFVDVQEAGPFASWQHRHRFLDTEHGARLVDEVDYRIPLGPVGALFAGPFIRSKLAEMFAFRHRRTAFDLARHAAHPGPPRTVAITGATGMVGSALGAFLDAGGHTVRRVVRRNPEPTDILWNVRDQTIDRAGLEGVDAVVHLAGAPIAAARWDATYKKAILDSRVEGTRLLAETLAAMSPRPSVLISASAIGFYGDRGDEVLTEESSGGTGFLADVCEAWEAATAPAEAAGIRVVRLRVGIVLGAEGGALRELVPIFAMGGGGPLGTGRQWQSWIALDDLVGAIHHLIGDVRARGAVNGTAPSPVRQRDLAKTLGRVLCRPAIAPAPEAVLRIALGEKARPLLLDSQRVHPERLASLGYAFGYPGLEDALRHTLGRTHRA